MSGGLSFLRTGFANMVYSCPETVSDVYVNQGEELQKGREGGRERRGMGGAGRGERSRAKGGVCKNAKPWFTSAGS